MTTGTMDTLVYKLHPLTGGSYLIIFQFVLKPHYYHTDKTHLLLFITHRNQNKFWYIRTITYKDVKINVQGMT